MFVSGKYRLDARLDRAAPAACPRCTAACDALERTVALCRSLPGDLVPANVRDAVRGAILGAIARWPDVA